MTRRTRRPRVVAMWPHGRHSEAIRGSVSIVHPQLQRLDIPYQWSDVVRGYVIPRTRADDLAAALEDAGHIVATQLSYGDPAVPR